MASEGGLNNYTNSKSSFNPSGIGLPLEFALTDYTRLKGCSCKLPQPKLLNLLQTVCTTPGQKDVGMDCSVVQLQHKNENGESLFMVSTTDFFFPSVEDPYLQGQIGAANVLSDLYSMGIDRCDTMLMLLAASTDMDEKERDVSTREMMKGFVDHVRLAGSDVTGGQTVMNPWPLIGGVASSVVAELEMVRPTGIHPGDVLVLTKPLGNQLAVNLKQWLRRPSPIFEEAIQGKMTVEEVEELYNAATKDMKRLNRSAATLMRRYGAHGATDITGFGILGHAHNLAVAQNRSVCFILEALPIYKGAVKASRLMGDKYKLFQGTSAETSGGLLVAFSDHFTAERYIKELADVDRKPAWIIGKVVEQSDENNLYAKLQKEYKILENIAMPALPSHVSAKRLFASCEKSCGTQIYHRVLCVFFLAAAASASVDSDDRLKKVSMWQRRSVRRRRMSGYNGNSVNSGGVNFFGMKFSGEAISVALMVLILTTLWEIFNTQRENISKKLKELCFVTLEVRSSREEYMMILDWMGRQPDGKRARNISLMPVSVRDEIDCADANLGVSTGGNQFVPGFGSHYMKFRSTRLWITRSIDTTKQYRSSSRVDREDEVLELVFLTRNRDVVREFIEDVRLAWDEQSGGAVRLYLPGGWGNRWEFLARRLRRPLYTLYLPRSTTAVVEEARMFLQSKALYMSLGVPWRRGYLFEGAPGTGKTSLILALASELSLPIYLLSLQSKDLDDTALIGLINSVPPKSLLVIEDLENAIKISHTATSSLSSTDLPDLVPTEVGGGRDSGVSLSALLNAIDGIASSEGRLLIITVNDSLRLPWRHALLRPGRIDKHILFGPISSSSMKEMVQSFQSKLAQPFMKEAFALLEQKDTPTTPAELQNQLLAAIYKKKLNQ